MIKKDVESFLLGYRTKSNSVNKPFLEEISVLSRADKNKSVSRVLVDSAKKMFDFDELTKDVCSSGSPLPTSVDGIFVSNNTVYFVEFKQGFRKRITKENFNQDKMTCINDSTFFCKDYKDLFFKNQQTETDELIANLHLKSAEAYITFEKKILPLCTDVVNKKQLHLIVVIDGNADDEQEFTSGGKQQSNIFFSVEESLKSHFRLQQDGLGNDFFYDKINVFSANQFKIFAKQFF